MSRGIKIIGSQGWIKWEIQAETVLWQTLDSDVEKRIDLSQESDNDRDMYEKQAHYFLSCISSKTDSDNNIEHGLAVLETAIACKKSSIKQKFIKL